MNLRRMFRVTLLTSASIRASASTARNIFSKGARTASSTATDEPIKRLTEQSMCQNLRQMEYAVRGMVVIKADEINQQLKESPGSFPFDHIVYTNIGNPHSVGQKPLTWPRQVMALVDLPMEGGIDHPIVSSMFPADAIERAKLVKEGLGGHGSGAYTHSQGPMMFREEICRFIEERDGLEKGAAIENNIFMTNGASAGIEMILNALIADPSSGVMIPRPQYPIYSATIEKLGGKKVGYAMDEKKGWSASLEELERSLAEAQKDGIKVNSFVLINPGNPTGQVLTPEAVRDVVKFCSKHNLVLLADEVYQENVYAEKKKFYSCRHAARDAGLDDGKVELVSFHSTSKGLLGECGRRGGYMDMVGFDPLIRDQMYKLASSNLCANVPGQVMTSIMVNGPKKGDVSYEKHEEEKKKIYDGLRKRAKIVGDGFNTIPGISCEPVQGSMYCFPKVDIPAGAIAAAEAQGITPDTLYAVSLLENTGICVVPASGFGQEKGRCGFRTTFLPSEDEMFLVVDKVRKHHGEFCEKYQ